MQALDNSLNSYEESSQLEFFPFFFDKYINNKKLEELRIIAFNPLNVYMMPVEITKIDTFTMSLLKSTAESNTYVRFGYSPLIVF